MFLKAMMSSFRMSHRTFKTPKSWAKNEPITYIPPPIPPRFFQPQIGERKQSRLAKRNIFLKAMMVSFQMNLRTSKMPKDWARMNLYNMHLTFYIADASSDL